MGPKQTQNNRRQHHAFWGLTSRNIEQGRGRMRSPETLWVAGSSPAGGANSEVNGMLTFTGRTDPARWDLYGTLTAQGGEVS